MPEAFNQVYRKIVSEFFPQSTKYEYGWGVELEVYPSQDISNPDYTCEFWIAVKENKTYTMAINFNSCHRKSYGIFKIGD